MKWPSVFMPAVLLVGCGGGDDGEAGGETGGGGTSAEDGSMSAAYPTLLATCRVLGLETCISQARCRVLESDATEVTEAHCNATRERLAASCVGDALPALKEASDEEIDICKRGLHDLACPDLCGVVPTSDKPPSCAAFWEPDPGATAIRCAE